MHKYGFLPVRKWERLLNAQKLLLTGTLRPVAFGHLNPVYGQKTDPPASRLVWKAGGLPVSNAINNEKYSSAGGMRYRIS